MERSREARKRSGSRAPPLLITTFRQSISRSKISILYDMRQCGRRRVIDFLTLLALSANERSLFLTAGHNFMRQANAQLQADRRSEILEAAQGCFARAGFHQTSMQE